MFNEIISSLNSGLLIALPLAACSLLAVAAFTDLTSRIIPNWISVSLFLLFALFVVAGGQKSEIWQHYLWGMSVFIALLPLFAFKKIGGGDVKLLAMTTLWVGPISGAEFLILTTLIGAGMALVIISPRIKIVWEWWNMKLGTHGLIDLYPDKRSLPYGVAIAVAGCFVISNIYFGHLVEL